MSKVFPSSTVPASYTNTPNYKHPRNVSNARTPKLPNADATCGRDTAAVLTVWKKSLLANCTGFTVFDGEGNLVFRVDNYVASNIVKIVLMDATGKPLFTIRRKRLSLGQSWMIYQGEIKTTSTDPKYCARRHVNLLNSNNLAHVTLPKNNVVVYKIEGSYAQRSVSVYDCARRCVAEIRRKEGTGGVALGVDVFSLVVSSPHMDTAMAMAIVMLLDQMFESTSTYSYHSRRYSP